jgi:hypothetical protein
MTCQCTRVVGELHPCTNETEPGAQLCDCCRLCCDLGGICSAPFAQDPPPPPVDYEKTKLEGIQSAIQKAADETFGA